MPTQDPRHTPLTGEEAELARVLRALPAGEPPARVDAAILAAAADAVAQRPRRRLPAWAMGTAAAAVLAVAVVMQLRPSPERLPAADAAPAAGAEAPAKAAEPAVAAEATPETPDQPAALAESTPAAEFASEVEESPASGAGELDSITVTGSRLRQPPASAPAQSDAAPPAEPELAEPAADRQAEARRDAGAAPPTAGQRAEVDLQYAPPPPAPPAMARPIAAPVEAALPPVDADTGLPAEDWLARIRERQRQGDHAGARASLLRFIEAHPGHPIPDDLDGLRR